MAAICVALFVGGIAAIIAMLVEIWEADARRVRRWLRRFLGERKEART
jgi:hypothetical protein